MRKYVLVLTVSLLGSTLSTVRAQPVGYGNCGAEGCYGGTYGFSGLSGNYYNGVFVGNGAWSNLNYMFGGIPGHSWLPYGGTRYLNPVPYGSPIPHGYPTSVRPPFIADQPLDATVQGNNEVVNTSLYASEAAATAKLIVHAPPVARLSIDGVPTRVANPVRVLVTPRLEPNKDFHYTLKAEMIFGGQTHVVTEKVTIRAGEEKEVVIDFANSTPANQ